MDDHFHLFSSAIILIKNKNFLLFLFIKYNVFQLLSMINYSCYIMMKVILRCHFQEISRDQAI